MLRCRRTERRLRLSPVLLNGWGRTDSPLLSKQCAREVVAAFQFAIASEVCRAAETQVVKLASDI